MLINFPVHVDMKLRSGRILQIADNVPNLQTIPTPSQNPNASNALNTTVIAPANLNVTNNVSTNSSANTTTSISTSPIKPCGACVTCRRGTLKTDPVYVNKITGEKFEVTENLNCKSTGILYLITCANFLCPMQYVGQTMNSVNIRCIQHRSGLKNGNEPKFVREHFTRVHDPSDLRITPLCSIASNDSNPSTKRKSLISALKEHEDKLILKLNTLYPYGLNDRLEKPVYMDAEIEFLKGACIYKVFPVRKATRQHRGSKKPKTQNNFVTCKPDDILSSIEELYLHGNLHNCRTIICNLKNKVVISLGNLAQSKISSAKGLSKMCFTMVKDLCNHFRARNVSFDKFRKNTYKVSPKPSNKFSEFVPITFITKELESLGLDSILNDTGAMKYFPYKDLSKKFSNIDFRFSTCYKYEKSIRAGVTNYKENILNDDPDCVAKCYCNLYSDFIDPTIGHVISGDVRLVPNLKLRRLFKKGYTFIEPIYKTKFQIFRCIRSDINSYIKSLSTKFSVNITFFEPWKAIVFEKN